jgi:hypothetical protein
MEKPAMTIKPPLCVMKKELMAMLGFDSMHTINDLIARGVIPQPLPGSRHFYLPAVFRALERNSVVTARPKEGERV